MSDGADGDPVGEITALLSGPTGALKSTGGGEGPTGTMKSTGGGEGPTGILKSTGDGTGGDDSEGSCTT